MENHLPTDSVFLAGGKRFASDADEVVLASTGSDLVTVKRKGDRFEVSGAAPGMPMGSPAIWKDAQRLMASDAWMIGDRIPAPVDAMLTGNYANLRRILAPFRKFEGTLQGDRATIRGECATAEAATRAANELRGLFSLIRGTNASVDEQGATVTVSADVSFLLRRAR